MKLCEHERSNVQLRTLDHLREQLQEFQQKSNSDLKKAKEYYNVIHEPLIDIPLDQVSTSACDNLSCENWSSSLSFLAKFFLSL